MKPKLSLSFAKLLRELLIGELNFSAFQGANRRQLEIFFDDEVLTYRLIGRQQKSVYCVDKTGLANYLHNKFEIPDLHIYIEFMERAEFGRSEAVLAGSNSKLRRTRVFTGFLLNSYDALACELNSEPFQLKPARGAFTFVADFETFKIPPHVTVVVVEGHENFREIHKQKNLFKGITPLFVWRYQNSNAIVRWINLIANEFIHFGDFDPKGIHIYLSEVKNKVSGTRGHFFIPENVEELLLNYGEKELYEKQKSILPHIQNLSDSKLAALVGFMMKYQKGLAQEILIIKPGD